jgi:uncharacterized membrane protein
VTKRDEIAMKNRKLIREARSMIKNQKQMIIRKERQEMVLKNAQSDLYLDQNKSQIESNLQFTCILVLDGRIHPTPL